MKRKVGAKGPLLVLAVLVGAAVIAVSSVPGLGTSLGISRFFGTSKGEVLYAPVGKGKLPVTVVERGSLESSSNLDVVNEVEGMTTIIKILPEGTPVKKGTDVRLVSKVVSTSETPATSKVANPSAVPATNKDVCIVTLDEAKVLHFGVFDGEGKQVLDTDEKSLTDKAPLIEALKTQLEPMWPPHDLAVSEKDLLITALTPILGPGLKNWEMVCELDSANLRDQLVNQEISTKRAEADLEQAKKTREVAEIAVNEYREGTYPQDQQSAEGQIKLAEADLIRAQDRLEWSDRMLLIGYVTQTQNQADKLALQKSEFTLRENQTKLNVLRKYTYEKQIKELQANVEKAKSDELAKTATYELEKSKEEKLRKQINKCKLFAPGDGLIVYANEQNRFGSNQPMIEEGASVRERQRIFSLPDITKMRVNAKVHESMVDRVRQGLKGRIRVDAFPQQLMTGTVDSIQPLPDPTSFFGSDIKVYTTLVTIDNGFSGLRPGMTAQVEILVTQLDNVVSIPAQAILEYKGKDYVYVNTANGPVKREIKLGISNDTLVEIKEGLKQGEEVALSPAALMTDSEKREAFAVSSKGEGKTGDWSADAIKAGKGGPGPAAAKKKGGGGAAGAFREKLQKVSAEDRGKLFNPETSEADRSAILKKAGFTDDEAKQMIDMGKQMQQGGGPPGGPGGPGGGGPGGGPGGGGGRRGGGPPQ